MDHRKNASLAFYVAFLETIPKILFPQIITAFETFTETGNWDIIKKATGQGYAFARQCSQKVCGIFLEGKQKHDLKWAEKEITDMLLKPLGII